MARKQPSKSKFDDFEDSSSDEEPQPQPTKRQPAKSKNKFDDFDDDSEEDEPAPVKKPAPKKPAASKRSKFDDFDDSESGDEDDELLALASSSKPAARGARRPRQKKKKAKSKAIDMTEETDKPAADKFADFDDSESDNDAAEEVAATPEMPSKNARKKAKKRAKQEADKKAAALALLAQSSDSGSSSDDDSSDSEAERRASRLAANNKGKSMVSAAFMMLDESSEDELPSDDSTDESEPEPEPVKEAPKPKPQPVATGKGKKGKKNNQKQGGDDLDDLLAELAGPSEDAKPAEATMSKAALKRLRKKETAAAAAAKQSDSPVAAAPTADTYAELSEVDTSKMSKAQKKRHKQKLTNLKQKQEDAAQIEAAKERMEQAKREEAERMRLAREQAEREAEEERVREEAADKAAAEVAEKKAEKNRLKRQKDKERAEKKKKEDAAATALARLGLSGDAANARPSAVGGSKKYDRGKKKGPGKQSKFQQRNAQREKGRQQSQADTQKRIAEEQKNKAEEEEKARLADEAKATARAAEEAAKAAEAKRLKEEEFQRQLAAAAAGDNDDNDDNDASQDDSGSDDEWGDSGSDDNKASDDDEDDNDEWGDEDAEVDNDEKPATAATAAVQDDDDEDDQWGDEDAESSEEEPEPVKVAPKPKPAAAKKNTKKGGKKGGKRQQQQQKSGEKSDNDDDDDLELDTAAVAAGKGSGKYAGDKRSPICCILGHVDTGKTKILDNIRQTSVQDGEAGGITQQIGATFLPMHNIKEKTAELNQMMDGKIMYDLPGLLVIDTPGHESFTNLRSRGSSLCDIAILVVDIMHGLEPQTLESLQLLRDKKTPFVIALNKIDRMYDWQIEKDAPFNKTFKNQPQHAQDEFEQRWQKIQLEFSQQGLNTELYFRNKDFRKNISVVPTSAITGEGLPDLLMLLIQLTQKMMSARLQYISSLECTILEVKQTLGHGVTLDVILSNGVLHNNDRIVVCGMDGPIETKVRGLLTPHPMKEIRVKGDLQRHAMVKASMGVKISAPGLDKAIAGSQLLVCKPGDDIEDLKDEVMKDYAEMMARVSRQDKGVYVVASTLGSLEALMSFLDKSKIPVCGISIGTVTKKDVTKASVMLEWQKEYACILAFNVDINREAAKLASGFGVKIFEAEIIYHLFDEFTAYLKEVREERRATAKAVFPVQLEVLPQHIIRQRSPIIMGVYVRAGMLKVGTPLVAQKEDGTFTKIGTVAGIQIEQKDATIAKKGDECAIKINAPSEQNIMYGRHFDATHTIVSLITRESIDDLKENFKDDLEREDWMLVIKLKKYFRIGVR